MKYIESLKESDNVKDIYFVKQKTSAITKNGKPYDNLILQDKTGTIDAKIWDPNSAGIDDFDAMDYVEVNGSVLSYNGALQINVKRVRKCHESEYNTADYLPVSSKNIDGMFAEIIGYVDSVKSPYLNKLLCSFFKEDEVFIDKFKKSSAAKSVHHGFIGGLLEHTLSVTNMCNYYASAYPIINRDLLITVAMLHDIGKTKELSLFPENDYTDAGQMLGHIVMGCEMVGTKIDNIEDFPVKLSNEVRHCILAHHGEFEFGSPKKPAIIEAVALNFADNTDAKMETLTELFNSTQETGWLGFNRFIDSNVRKTSVDL